VPRNFRGILVPSGRGGCQNVARLASLGTGQSAATPLVLGWGDLTSGFPHPTPAVAGHRPRQARKAYCFGHGASYHTLLHLQGRQNQDLTPPERGTSRFLPDFHPTVGYRRSRTAQKA